MHVEEAAFVKRGSDLSPKKVDLGEKPAR